MKSTDVLLLGMKKRVAMIEKATGRVLWEAKLGGGAGNDFVTIVCDGSRVFAASSGHLHCLDFQSGQLLWSNGLSGFGYGIATLCVPGGETAPSPSALASIRAQQDAAAGNAAATP